MLRKEPKWISEAQALSIHDHAIKRHGGINGVRDIGLLRSAMARAENFYAYGETNIFELAAAYAVGIAKNHPFLDGNKRTAYSVASLFLFYNGYKLLIHDVKSQVKYFEFVAMGSMPQNELAQFYANHTIPVE